MASDGSALMFVFGGTRDTDGRMKIVISDFCVYSWGECCLCLSQFSSNFLLLSVSPDPQTPTTVSVCDNPTAWLQRDISDHQLRRRLREITAEKDELVSQVRHLSEEKRSFDKVEEGNEKLIVSYVIVLELVSQNTRLAGEIEQLTLQCETLRAEKDQSNREKEGG